MTQGGLITGLLYALAAMDMSGPGMVFLSQHWTFTALVYIDDTQTVGRIEAARANQVNRTATRKLEVERTGVAQDAAGRLAAP